MTTDQARLAIEESIQRNEIVCLKGFRECTQEWHEIRRALSKLADDWVETDAMGASQVGVKVIEYWGCDDGDNWRVHVFYTVD